MNQPKTRSAKILVEAIKKTDDVQENLQEAAEALSGANAVLSGPLTPSQEAASLAGAVQQNLEAEAKVHNATQELETVKGLLQEVQVAQTAAQAGRNSGEGTASILGYFEGRRAQAREDEERAAPKD